MKTYVCTYRESSKDACRCGGSFPPLVESVRHWKDDKEPKLKPGEAICDKHAIVPGCMMETNVNRTGR